MDMILRSLRKVDQWMGGVWIVAAGDHNQCGTVDDMHPPLLSMGVRHNFDCFPMTTLFRLSVYLLHTSHPPATTTTYYHHRIIINRTATCSPTLALYLRSRNDPTLMDTINILRHPLLDEDTILRAAQTIESHCILVDTEDEVPPEAIWYLPTNDAVQARFTECQTYIVHREKHFLIPQSLNIYMIAPL